MSTIEGNVRKILANMKGLLAQQAKMLAAQIVLCERIDAVEVALQRIITDLEPAPATAFRLTYGDNEMANGHANAAGIDFEMKDDGSAVATLDPHDAAGNGGAPMPPTHTSPPVWSSNNPAALTVTPAADGMSAALTPGVPPITAAGILVSAVSTGTDGSTISTDPDTQLLDVVADTATGFRVALA